MHPLTFVSWLSLLLLTSAKTIVITVGGNTASNPGAVFAPQTVRADQGDIVLFNFTQGNHSATQSTFGSPCLPAHKTNSTINGFDSWYRNAGNYSAVTQLTYVIADPKVPVWFFDYGLCAKGGVGAINTNESSTETFSGFVRNALRLYGAQPSSSSHPASTSLSKATKAAASDTPSATQGGMVSSADRAIVVGFYAVAPTLAMLVVLSL